MNPTARLMPSSAWQPDFAHALLDAEQPVPSGLRTWNGSDPAARFAVYRNNVAASLTRALADLCPVVRELVGAEFFAAMARCHLADCPPRTPVLAEYGDDFPPWLEQFAPAAEVPYLADMARLEIARVRATHAADHAPLPAAVIPGRIGTALTGADAAAAQRLAASRPRLHPSLSVIASRFTVVSLWAAHQGRGRIEDVALDAAEAALVLRRDGTGDSVHEPEVLVCPLSAAGACLVQRLLDGDALADAAVAATAIDPHFEPGPALALLIAHGAVVDWHLAGD
jgi:hypothetical protein